MAATPARVVALAALATLAPVAVTAQSLTPLTEGIVPVVSHTPGQQGSSWTTTLSISQTSGTSPAHVVLTVRDPAGPGWSTSVDLAAAGGAAEVADVVRFVDPAIPDGNYVLTWTASAPVMLTAHTFTRETAGTFGQGIGSLAPGSGFGTGDTVVFPTPMDAARFRVNVGIANAGAAAQTFTIAARNAAGSPLAMWTRDVPAGGIRQLRTNTLGSGAGAVAVTCDAGCDGTVFAYASVVVNDSNDPYFLYAATGNGGGGSPAVTTTRDAYGVVSISGGDLAGVFDALGYVVAVDRLWQAELFRRQARGRLSEILGDTWLEVDAFIRTVGYSDAELDAAYVALDDESRSVVDAYLAGLNRRLAEVRADHSLLPYEAYHTALPDPVEPAEWTPRDLLAWMALAQRFFDPEGLQLAGPASGQLDNAALLQSLVAAFPDEGAAMFADLRWLDDPAAVTMLDDAPVAAHRRSPLPAPPPMPDLRPAAARVRGRLIGLRDALDALGARVDMGSQAWVVDGDHTADHRPILFSGPQMGFTVPSVALEVSLRGGGLQVSGMTIAGLPGVIIGRTPHHAWSLQVGHAHTADFYLDDPATATLDRIETIRVAGGADVTLPVYRTAHGPVVDPLPLDPGSPPAVAISWKYAHRDLELDIVGFALQAARATSVADFGQAVAQVAVSQHFCYADVDGHIAYWMSGRDPVRPATVDVRLPLAGDGSAEWVAGQLKPLPHGEDPSRGFYGGWNNRASHQTDGSPNNLEFQFGPAHRAQLVADALSGRDDLSFAELRQLALDISTTDSYDGGGDAWRWVTDAFTAAVTGSPTPARTAALALLDGWDGHLVTGGAAAWPDATTRADAWTLQRRWVDEALKLTFEDEFRAAGLDWETQPRNVLLDVLLHQLAGAQASLVNRYDWFRDRAGSGAPTTADGIIVAALDTALAALGAQPWAAPRGTIDLDHDLLGEIAAVPFANRSSYAQIVELGPAGPTRIESVFPLGQAGTILRDSDGEPLFDDRFLSLQTLFEAFEMRPFPIFD